MFTAQKVRAPIAGWLATPQCRTVEQYAQVTKTPYVFDHNARNFQSFFPIEVRFVAVDSLNEVNLPPFCCITCKLQGIGLIFCSLDTAFQWLFQVRRKVHYQA